MIEALISSKTRVKLLLKFFLNSSNKAYLRGLEDEFGESTNAIRLELNRFEQVGIITSDLEGNKKFYTANQKHPLFTDLQNIVKKYIGIDTIIENVINQLGKIEKVFVTGNFANGLKADIIDLEFVGVVDENYLITLIKKVEPIIKLKIRYIIYSAEEYAKPDRKAEKRLLIWSK